MNAPWRRWFAVALLVGIVSCTTPTQQANQTVQDLASPKVTAGSRDVDTAFVRTALALGTRQYKRGALEAQSTDRNAQLYGAMIVKDIGSINQQLEALASKHQIFIGTGALPNANASASPAAVEHGAPKSMIALSKPELHPPAYFKTEIRANQAAIDLYTHEQNLGRKPDIRAFAKTTLPIIQKHLQEAQKDVKSYRNTAE